MRNRSDHGLARFAIFYVISVNYRSLGDVRILNVLLHFIMYAAFLAGWTYWAMPKDKPQAEVSKEAPRTPANSPVDQPFSKDQ